jgi:anti-sigma B factor antagonist
MNLGDLRVTTQDGLVIARLTGEIDLSNAQGIEESVSLATPNHATGVVLELSELEYIDSAGIQLIYRLREKLHNRGQCLRLVVGAGSPALDALRMAGVADHLDLRTTLDEALE